LAVKNSTILFIVALLILAWFGAEVVTAQEICVTSCISLSGWAYWEQAIAVLVLPLILILGGIQAKRNEKKGLAAPANTKQQQ
jgi:hypothetical protein